GPVDVIVDRVQDALARADAAGDVVVRPVAVGDVKYRANAICCGTFAPLRRGAGEQGEEHGIVLGAFDEVVRLPPDHVPEADVSLQQQRHRISFGVRQDCRYHLAGEAVVGGRVQQRPGIAARAHTGLAVAGRRVVRLKYVLAPILVLDVRGLHDITTS